MGFTSEAVEEVASLHGDPEWLRARRREAFEIFERLPLPSKSDEEWRRTDISALNLDDFQPYEQANGAAPADPIEGAAAVLRQRGSEPGHVELPEELRKQGVIFMPLSQAVREVDWLEKHLFAATPPDRDKFAALHSAFFSGGTFLWVPDGVVIEQPLVSQFWSSGGGAAVLPHSVIKAGRGAVFNYVDEFLSPDLDQPALTSGSAEIWADESANVGYLALQRWGKHAWQFANRRAMVRDDAHVRIVDVGLGGRFAKTRVEAGLYGSGATAELKGLFFGSESQFFDYHTLQSHLVGNTTSDLLFKGALRDQARSVYAGLIRIEKGAQHSDAYQANRNLLLSKQANAYSIPMLEILNNEVRCTHGATIAPVDPEQLFYLESRGIAHATAERMIVHGFFGEVLDRIPVQQARDLVEQELEARIG